MQYYKNSIKKEYFLITPKEFENVFADYTFVSTSGVKKGTYQAKDRKYLICIDSIISSSHPANDVFGLKTVKPFLSESALLHTLKTYAMKKRTGSAYRISLSHA